MRPSTQPVPPWQLLIQNAVWGDGDLKADNQAITDVLGQ